MSSDRPLVTFAEVRSWESRVAEILVSIRDQTEEMNVLVRKIDAAKVLIDLQPMDASVPDLPETVVTHVGAPAPAPEEPISQIILTAVGAVKAPAKSAAIRKWLSVNHPEVSAKLEANPAYFYTTLTRHVRAGRLSKRGKAYRVVQNSPKGESGGVAPPVPSTPN